jgi:hypothetical protein
MDNLLLRGELGIEYLLLGRELENFLSNLFPHSPIPY